MGGREGCREEEGWMDGWMDRKYMDGTKETMYIALVKPTGP